MRKILLAALLLVAVYFGYIAVTLALLPPVSDLADKKQSLTIMVKDWQGEEHQFVLGPANRRWTSLGRITAEMKWAVILAEDSNFYKHEGIDVKAIREAIRYDLEKRSLARGASTITQQVAKNIYLSREKSITRKLKELYLAWRMEQELTKGRILELYMNLVELGPMVYGIGHGSQYYFGHPPSDLTPRESAFLAAMLPGPRVAYNPYRNLGKVLGRSNMILRKLRSANVISKGELQLALASSPNITGLQRKVNSAIEHPPVMLPISSAVAEPEDKGGKSSEHLPEDGADNATSETSAVIVEPAADEDQQ